MTEPESPDRPAADPGTDGNGQPMAATAPERTTGRPSLEAIRSASDPYALHEPEPLPIVMPTPKPTRRESITAGVRISAAIAGLAVAVAAIFGATVISGATLVTRDPGIVVTPAAAAQQRVCPGPIQAASDTADPTLSPVGNATVNYRATAGTIFADRLNTAADVANAGPLRLTLPPRGDGSALIAGSETQVVASNGLSGLAVAECAQASGDSWLVGGSTDVGRSTLLMISNPSAVPATVAIEIFGEAGRVSAPGMAGLVVAPGALRGFSVAGFAPGVLSPVVHVSSRGGPVVATLQQTTVRTLQPGGVDLIGVAQQPARTATIPGLVTTTTAGITAAQGSAGNGDLEPAVRLLVPGSVNATATVTITAEAGTAPAPSPADDGSETAPSDASPTPVAGVPVSSGTSFPVSLVAGRVSDIALPGLGDGSYVVTITATEPVVAAARTSGISASAASDFAWLASAGALGQRQLVSVAPGPQPTLHVANPGRKPRTVTVTSGAVARSVVVPARGGASLALVSGETVVLTGANGLTASVSFVGDAQIAGFSVSPPDAGSRPITVFR